MTTSDAILLKNKFTLDIISIFRLRLRANGVLQVVTALGWLNE
jgi:hypothetical protein